MQKINTQNTKERIISLAQADRAREACVLCRKLCHSTHADADSWFMLGVLEGQLGRTDDAIHAYRRAVTLDPEHLTAHYNLGYTLLISEHRAEAIDSFREAVRIKPDFPEALTNLGALLKESGELEQAVEFHERAIKTNPNFSLAHYNLGNALFEKADFESAIRCYQNAIRLNPNYADAYANMGDALMKQFLRAEAVQCYRNALRLHSTSTGLRCSLADALASLGKYAEALQHYDIALSQNLADFDSLSGKALVHERQGRPEAALELLDAHAIRQTGHVRLATAFAKISRKVKRNDDAILWLRKLLNSKETLERQRFQLHFSLGVLFDAVGEYDSAFENFRRGNALKRVSDDPAFYTREMDVLTGIYTAEFMKSAPRAAHGSDRPVFIVGMPRSGTTLAEQILASHPSVFGAGELETINRIMASLPRRISGSLSFPECLRALKREHVEAAAREYLHCLEQLSPDAARVTDKMPHNFLALGFIELMFPNARVVHCVRDPMDTCLSIYSNYDFNANHGYAFDLTCLGAYYRRYRALMEHWQRILRIPILELRYEDLVADQEAKSRELVAFCGLEWDNRCLRFYQTERIANTPSYDQVRQPIYTKSVGRWKHYERHLEPLWRALDQAESPR